MLPPLYKYPITFPTLGWQVGQWIEEMLCHGPGDVQSKQIVLDLEELAWLCWAYRVEPQLLASGAPNPKAGRRLVHRAIYCRSKGQRKIGVRRDGVRRGGARARALRRL